MSYVHRAMKGKLTESAINFPVTENDNGRWEKVKKNSKKLL